MMKFGLVSIFFLATLLNVHNAAAFSRDQGANQNSDGSAKFADPDEQMPDFMTTPDNAANGNKVLSFGSSVVTMPSAGENTSGAKAFDQAFAHKQDKE